ncbi:ribosomal protein S27-domain-containing protein, partial [Mycena alexandri]
GCFTITTVFSHAHTVVLCGSCASVLCQPTGGKARLTDGASRPDRFTPRMMLIPPEKLDRHNTYSRRFWHYCISSSTTNPKSLAHTHPCIYSKLCCP